MNKYISLLNAIIARSLLVVSVSILSSVAYADELKDISHSFERYIIQDKNILGEINVHQTFNGRKVCENIKNYVLRPIIIKDGYGLFRILRIDLITKL